MDVNRSCRQCRYSTIQLIDDFKIWVWISTEPAAKELDALKWLEDFEVWGMLGCTWMYCILEYEFNLRDINV